MLFAFLAHISQSRAFLPTIGLSPQVYQPMKSRFELRDTLFEHLLDTPIFLSTETFNQATVYDRIVPQEQLLVLKSTRFHFCETVKFTHDGSDGGAISMHGIQLDAQLCSFRENHAINRGGAINLRSSSKANIDTCIFDRNRAERSVGAVSFAVAFDSTIFKSNFSRNACPHNISAVAFSVCLAVSMKQTVFYNNSAGNNGAIANMKSKLSLRDAYFFENRAKDCTAVFLTREAVASCVSTKFGDGQTSPSIYGTKGVSLIVKLCSFVRAKGVDIFVAGELTARDNVYEASLKTVKIREYPEILPPRRRGADGNGRENNWNGEDLEQEVQLGVGSVVMVIAYLIVIAMLVFGAKMYFFPRKGEENAADTEALCGNGIRNEASSDDRPTRETLNPSVGAKEAEEDEVLPVAEPFETADGA